jgi:hypothetical protein
MFAQLQQTFLAKNPCKKSADLHPGQGNLGTTLEHFYRLNSTSLYLQHEIGWRPAEKNSPLFSNMRLLCSNRISMDMA